MYLRVFCWSIKYTICSGGIKYGEGFRGIHGYTIFMVGRGGFHWFFFHGNGGTIFI